MACIFVHCSALLLSAHGVERDYCESLFKSYLQENPSMPVEMGELLDREISVTLNVASFDRENTKRGHNVH